MNPFSAILYHCFVKYINYIISTVKNGLQVFPLCLSQPTWKWCEYPNLLVLLGVPK